MGQKQSAESIQRSFTEAISKNMTEIVTKTMNSQNLDTSINQSVQLDIRKGAVFNCSLEVLNKAKASSQAVAYFQTNTTTDMQNQIKQAVDNALKTSKEQESPSFSLVPYSQQDSNTFQEINNKVLNIIDTVIKNETFNSCNSKIAGKQDIYIPISGTVNCPKGGEWKLTNEMVAENISNCAVNNVITQVFKNSTMQDLVNKAVDDQKNIISGWGAIAAIAIILVIILVVAYIIYKIRSPPKPDEIANFASLGQAMAPYQQTQPYPQLAQQPLFAQLAPVVQNIPRTGTLQPTKTNFSFIKRR